MESNVEILPKVEVDQQYRYELEWNVPKELEFDHNFCCDDELYFFDMQVLLCLISFSALWYNRHVLGYENDQFAKVKLNIELGLLVERLTVEVQIFFMLRNDRSDWSSHNAASFYCEGGCLKRQSNTLLTTPSILCNISLDITAHIVKFCCTFN